ncbi:unnamed protein product, partial [Meganyctiphanes norvegica]
RSQTNTMAIFKYMLAFAMICAYAKGMALPQSQRSNSRGPLTISSTDSKRIHSSGELKVDTHSSESLEVTPFSRGRRSASPRRGRYDGSHRSAPSRYSGSHRSA